MQLTASEDIEAPLDQVFAALTDFDLIEKQIMRRSIELKRTAGDGQAGTTWRAVFGFRGKQRAADITLSQCDAPETLVFDAEIGGLSIRNQVDCVALSRTRTRINLESNLSAQTLSARLMVQSLKLAKGGIDKRFRKGAAEYARRVEERLTAGA